ncbi:aromatase/cyclase [Glutamicibacter endophyticus]|uniref:aromatase/cyclase n=1 Tax=Glutamicibacter endophyticus TaxID=1522174 RepID=UPI003AF15CCA
MVNAKANRVYGFLSDVALWADIFPPTVYAEQIETSRNQELIQIWATANGEVRTWQSRRTFEPENRRITFGQTRPAAPLVSMSGVWEIHDQGNGASLVKLGHTYTAKTSEDADFIESAINTNSYKELESLRVFFAVPESEYAHGRVEDTLPISSSAAEAIEFLIQAEKWPERISHVADAELTRFDAGGELLRLTTRAKDGSTHQTASYRVVMSDSLIVYKQIETPGALVSHRGEWHVYTEDEQTYVKSVHDFALTRETVTEALGPTASLKDAVNLAGKNLMHNSTQTIKLIDSTYAKGAE